MDAVYLLDASGFIFRAYHAVRGGLKTSDGTPTNAVFGFAQMLLKLLNERKPACLIPVFDVSRHSFRQELFPAYKAQRPEPPADLVPQFALIRELVAAFGLKAVEREGYEADDLIGSLAARFAAEGRPVCIVSSDKDLLQLVDEAADVWVYDPWKALDIRAEGVRERFGVAPEQVVDVLGLAGDTSDNVPGVPGIGEKTASALVAEWGSMEAVLAHAGEVKGAKRQQLLRDYAEQARLSKTLVTIVREVPLEVDPADYDPARFDREELSRLLTRLEFTQLLGKLALAPSVPTAAVSRAKGDHAEFPYNRYRLVRTDAQLDELIARLAPMGRLVFDTETHTLDARTEAPLVGISFAWGEGEACYIPLAHRTGAQLDKRAVLARLAPLFADQGKTFVAHNAKFDAHVLESEGIRIAATLDDTMLMSYVLNPARESHGLDALAREWLGHEMIAYESVVGKGREATFAEVEPELACRYSAEDADATWRLDVGLRAELARLSLTELYEKVERPLMPVLRRMERDGMKVDRDLLAGLSDDFEALLQKTEARIYELAGGPFNIQSPSQLAEVLFTRLGLPAGRKTKTGYSTDVAVLTRLAPWHPLPALVLEYRQNAKLRSTYTEALQERIDPRDGRLHTSFNQAVTLTGRLSSSQPNLQNIPIRTEAGRLIRRAFVAEPGRVLLGADYSQIELRLLAHLAEDPLLIEAFRTDQDIHARTAAEVFGLLPGMVDREMRRRAKAINFGIVYGQSAFGLAESLGIPPKEARQFIENYFLRYAGVKRYIDEQHERAKREGVVYTLMGRRIPIEALAAGQAGMRQYGERVAINAPIQGSAADLIKLAMIRLDTALRTHGLRSRLVLQVHDELILEVEPEEREAAEGLVREAMEHVWELRVPLKADIHVGANWDDAH